MPNDAVDSCRIRVFYALWLRGAAGNLCYCQKIMRVGIVPNRAIKIRTLGLLDSQ